MSAKKQPEPSQSKMGWFPAALREIRLMLKVETTTVPGAVNLATVIGSFLLAIVYAQGSVGWNLKIGNWLSASVAGNEFDLTTVLVLLAVFAIVCATMITLLHKRRKRVSAAKKALKKAEKRAHKAAPDERPA